MKVIAFTGAGISKSAGIPTFEEIPHLKEKLSIEFKEAYPEEFEKAMNMLKTNIIGKEPTKAHFALTKYKIPIITMNIDGLHTKAGSEIVYEIHGNIEQNNVVLYGQGIHYELQSKRLIYNTAYEAEENFEKSLLLVIGTSMQTSFANHLVYLAESSRMKVYYINQNADEEVPKFLEENCIIKN